MFFVVVVFFCFGFFFCIHCHSGLQPIKLSLIPLPWFFVIDEVLSGSIICVGVGRE